MIGERMQRLRLLRTCLNRIRIIELILESGQTVLLSRRA